MLPVRNRAPLKEAARISDNPATEDAVAAGEVSFLFLEHAAATLRRACRSLIPAPRALPTPSQPHPTLAADRFGSAAPEHFHPLSGPAARSPNSAPAKKPSELRAVSENLHRDLHSRPFSLRKLQENGVLTLSLKALKICSVPGVGSIPSGATSVFRHGRSSDRLATTPLPTGRPAAGSVAPDRPSGPVARPGGRGSGQQGRRRTRWPTWWR
jgi:hypothetical protein